MKRQLAVWIPGRVFERVIGPAGAALATSANEHDVQLGDNISRSVVKRTGRGLRVQVPVDSSWDCYRLADMVAHVDAPLSRKLEHAGDVLNQRAIDEYDADSRG